jgi:hypothetical protein
LPLGLAGRLLLWLILWPHQPALRWARTGRSSVRAMAGLGDVRSDLQDVRLAEGVPVAVVVAARGEPAAREFLEVLERPDEERAALIGPLYARGNRTRWLAELLMDLEDDVGGIVRLRLADALRRRLSQGYIHGPSPRIHGLTRGSLAEPRARGDQVQYGKSLGR